MPDIREPPERGAAVLKVLFGVGLGFFLFNYPDAPQITADLLRSTANALAPEKDGKKFSQTRTIMHARHQNLARACNLDF